MALALSPLSARVRRADLSRSEIDDDVARALAAWSFTELILRNNPIRHRGLRALIDGGALDSIAVLDLCNTRVTDASVSPLLDPEHFPQLASLWLPNTVSSKLKARARQRLRR
jgi:hypothetical protein